MKFLYQAKNPSGEMQEGKIEATSREAVIALIQEKGFIPLMIEREKEVPRAVQDLLRIWNGINAKELSIFFRQFSTLIEAKVSIILSLKTMAEQTDNSYLKVVVEEMIDDIEDGFPLFDAMQKHSEVFTPLMVGMVKAGELSGNLQRSILFLADNTEKNYELNSKIRGALFYPLFVLGAAVVIGFFVFAFVLPKLTGIFSELDVTIPWYTKMFMNIADFMSVYWWAILLAILFIILLTVYYVKTEDGKREWDLVKMKIPIVGKLFQYLYIARFSENLSVLMAGGIPIVKALTLVGEVVNSTAYESVILRAADEVKAGGTMSSVLARSPQFPNIVSQMVKIGEESGKISEVLNNVALFYSKEVDRITRNLSTMIEPVLICFLGAGVGLLVFAVLVPIYNIAGSL